MPALQGLGVLVTRPEAQAMPLCRLLEAAGATALRLPAIDIEPAAELRDLGTRLGALEKFDLIVFVSANAVRYGSALLGEKRELSLAAIGPATARALNRAGYRVSLVPGQGFDSESLVAHPSLQHMAGRRVLLVKGRGGREFLAETFVRRGASVELAEVYERRAATPDDGELAALERRCTAGEIQVVTATSLEIAENLLRLATPALRTHFDRLHWLVPGDRVGAELARRGLAAPLLRADSAEDQDLVAALVRWRSSASGA